MLRVWIFLCLSVCKKYLFINRPDYKLISISLLILCKHLHLQENGWSFSSFHLVEKIIWRVMGSCLLLWNIFQQNRSHESDPPCRRCHIYQEIEWSTCYPSGQFTFCWFCHRQAGRSVHLLTSGLGTPVHSGFHSPQHVGCDPSQWEMASCTDRIASDRTEGHVSSWVSLFISKEALSWWPQQMSSSSSLARCGSPAWS